MLPSSLASSYKSPPPIRKHSILTIWSLPKGPTSNPITLEIRFQNITWGFLGWSSCSTILTKLVLKYTTKVHYCWGCPCPSLSGIKSEVGWPVSTTWRAPESSTRNSEGFLSWMDWLGTQSLITSDWNFHFYEMVIAASFYAILAYGRSYRNALLLDSGENLYSSSYLATSVSLRMACEMSPCGTAPHC